MAVGMIATRAWGNKMTGRCTPSCAWVPVGVSVMDYAASSTSMATSLVTVPFAVTRVVRLAETAEAGKGRRILTH